jgi:hypothetical protein
MTTKSKKPAPLIAGLLNQATRIERPTGKPMTVDTTALGEALTNAEVEAAQMAATIAEIYEELAN